MDLGSYAIFGSFAENLVGVFHCEESCITEYIHIVCKTFFRNCRQHLVAYKVYILRLASFVCAAYSVSTQEVCLYGYRSSLLDALDDAEHLEFIFDSQSISALDFHSSGTHGHNLTHAYHRLLIKFIFGSSMQQVCAVEDSAAACSNLLITQSCNLVTELSVPASGVHYMCV